MFFWFCVMAGLPVVLANRLYERHQRRRREQEAQVRALEKAEIQRRIRDLSGRIASLRKESDTLLRVGDPSWRTLSDEAFRLEKEWNRLRSASAAM